MTKADIFEEVATRTGIDKTDAAAAIETAMALIRQNMGRGRNIYIRGFGSFIVKKRKQKLARNITAGTQVLVPEHYIPWFKPSPKFVKKMQKQLNDVGYAEKQKSNGHG